MNFNAIFALIVLLGFVSGSGAFAQTYIVDTVVVKAKSKKKPAKPSNANEVCNEQSEQNDNEADCIVSPEFTYQAAEFMPDGSILLVWIFDQSGKNLGYKSFSRLSLEEQRQVQLDYQRSLEP